MLVSEATFVVVDTETTGFRRGADRLIEIAGVKVRGNKVLEEFAELVNPEQPVARRISRLTGITTDMVRDQPAAHEVLPRFLEFLGDGILVAHNLSFDLGFLNAELTRAGLPMLEGPRLCTLVLARRLLRGLPSKGLSSLIRFFNLPYATLHRALPDARAAKDILLRFIDQVAVEANIVGLDDFLRFQKRPYSTVSAPAPHLQLLRKTKLPLLPEGPGVYVMSDKKGRILYIGKAKDLAQRVKSYFAGIEGHPSKTRQLVRALRDITWTETDSEISALLLESRLIKEHQPRFNQKELRYRSRPFLRIGPVGNAPWVTVITYVRDDGSEYYGPFPGRQQAEMVAEALLHLFGSPAELPPEGLPAGFGLPTARVGGPLKSAGVEQAREFLQGRQQYVLELLESRMREASDAQDYERAILYRNWLRQLRLVGERAHVLGAALFDREAALVDEGSAQLHLVRSGRLVETLTAATKGAEHLRERLAAHYGGDAKRAARLSMQEADEVRILAQWIYQEREHIKVVTWTPNRDLDDFAQEILSRAE